MEFAMASAIGILTAAGVYLLLRARSFDVILGLTLLSYATNLLIFSSGRLFVGKAPVLREGVAPTLENYVDPLPQALVLTAIVIAFAMTAVMLVMAIRSRSDNASDHVDGRQHDPQYTGRNDSKAAGLASIQTDAAAANDAAGKDT